jgi:hypothetical protein
VEKTPAFAQGLCRHGSTEGMRMKRWLARLTICTYLSALIIGTSCHAMNFGLSSHPIFYYFVWDMFCGWSAHEIRYHLVGEGESGAHYQLSPAPWNTFAPYGDMERGQYDTLGNAHAKIAVNTLKHTDHEPITRIFLIEEVWSKKYNLPEGLWALRFDEPKDPHSYFWLKATMDGDGKLVQYNRDYLTNLLSMTIADNPRLKADSLRGKPFYAVNPAQRDSDLTVGHSTFMGNGPGVTSPNSTSVTKEVSNYGFGGTSHPSAN